MMICTYWTFWTCNFANEPSISKVVSWKLNFKTFLSRVICGIAVFIDWLSLYKLSKMGLLFYVRSVYMWIISSKLFIQSFMHFPPKRIHMHVFDFQDPNGKHALIYIYVCVHCKCVHSCMTLHVYTLLCV